MADKGGLEGVVVARSRLCSIDGQNGVLVYGGYDVGDLAEHSSYEEVCFLTLYGELPTKEQFDSFLADLSEHRELSEETAQVVDMLASHAAPMEMLRTAVSSDSFDDPDKDSNDPDANRRKATRLIAKMPTMVARYARRRAGEEPIPPDPALGHAANFLQMLTGERPSPAAAKTFDVALILHADHEMNASTFTARVIASTLSDMHSAITGAIGALKGPLHGGANEQVMHLLEAIPDANIIRRSESTTHEPAFFQLVLLAVLAGIGRAALADARVLVRDRKRTFNTGSGELFRSDPLILQLVGQLSAKVFAAESVVLAAARELDAGADPDLDLTPDQRYVRGEIAVEKAQLLVPELVQSAAQQLFDVTGASATSKSKSLDRHWRNARTVATHNPAVFKARTVGDWEVNGTTPEGLHSIGDARTAG